MLDDASKAFVSMRMIVDAARLLPNVDNDGNVIRTLATRVRVKDFPCYQLFKKMKYIIYKYVWENVSNEQMVIGCGLNVETLALEVNDMYENLGN